jgi:uncharacterized protein (DUF1697 family)
MRYVALLRGINVGGTNIIRMEALRVTFESLGFGSVATYIQSGNVVFEAKARSKATLGRTIESELGRAFGYDSKIVLVTAKELAAVVADAPPGFGSEPASYRYDVLFVKPPLTTRQVLAEVETAPGVDEVHAGPGVLYFRRLIAKATRSRLSRLVGKPVYQGLTIRNWNTTKRLLEMVKAEAGASRSGAQ